MNINEFKKNPTSFQTALKAIGHNYTSKYEWYNVVNKTGCLFELGGTNKYLKAYIPKFENGDYTTYAQNNMVENEYSLTQGSIEYSTFRVDAKKIANYEDFINFLDNTDFRIWKPEIKEVYETVVVLKGHKCINI